MPFRATAKRIAVTGTVVVRAAACLAALVPAMLAGSAHAQDYPNRAIRIIVTTSPGGLSDVFVRAISEPLHKALGQPVVVENRSGGFMIIGARTCADAAPDGYTFCVMPGEPLLFNQYTQKSLPYDPVKSFDPVTNLFFITQALGVSSKLGVKSLDELAAYSKAKGGTLSYSAPSSSLILFFENWKKKTGADIVRVPFKGGGDTVTNMLSGTTPVGFLGLGNFLSYIQSGDVTPLLVDSEQRSPLIPDTTTLGEIGFSREHTRAFFGLLAPAGTPKTMTERVRTEILKITSDPAFQKKHLTSRGLEPAMNTPDEFRAFLERDRVRAQTIVKMTTDQQK